MKRFRSAACALALALLWSVAVRTASAAPAVVTLKNGMRVVLAPDSLATAADVSVWFPNGSRLEPAGAAGVAHVYERVLARAASTVADGALLRSITLQGGTPGSSTTPDYTEVHETIAAEALPAALQLEAARLALGATDAATFEGARRASRDDLARALRAPVARGLQALYSQLYAGDGYARPLAGIDGDLARMTARNVDAWRAGFGPGAATLVITGRFAPEGTLALVKRLFENLPRGGAMAAAPALKPLTTGPVRAAIGTDVPARVVFAGWRLPGTGDPDAMACALIAQILGSDGSPLAKSLGDEWKVAVVAQAGIDERREASALWAFAVLAEDADTSTAERVLVDGVKRLAREPLPGELVDRVRAQMESAEALRLQTARGRAQAIGEGLLLRGAADASEKRLAQLRALTPADLQRVAARVFDDASRAVVWMRPATTEGGHN